MTTEQKPTESVGGKYLTFALAQEEYGIDILKIREIVGVMPITFLPRTPAYIRGVANLRGQVVPVMDLRARFGLEDAAYTDRTCIIVVEGMGESGGITLGLVVDRVLEVRTIRPEEIQACTEIGLNISQEFIRGIARMEEGVRILLNLDRLFAPGREEARLAA